MKCFYGYRLMCVWMVDIGEGVLDGVDEVVFLLSLVGLSVDAEPGSVIWNV